MASTLSQIKDALVAEIAKISGVAFKGTLIKAWYELPEFPAVFIAIGAEAKQERPTHHKTATATFVAAVAVKAEDPLQAFLDLYEQIEIEVEDSPTLGGLALDARITGFNASVTAESIAQGLIVADVFIEVVYRHTRGTP